MVETTLISIMTFNIYEVKKYNFFKKKQYINVLIDYNNPIKIYRTEIQG